MSVEGAFVVTGATGGMGRAIAAAFASDGRHLILCDQDAQALDRLSREMTGAASTTVLAGDITATEHVGAVVAAAAGRGIAALVHAAGVSPSMARGQRIFEINFEATRRLVDSATPHMLPGSAAILIASNSGQLIARPIFDRAIRRLLNGRRSRLVSALIGRSPQLAYSLSKRAVQLYAQAMAVPLGRRAVRIVSLSPGIIDTAMGRREQGSEPLMDRMIEASALQRMGQASEVAAVATFLASPAAGYITGADILVDGGTLSGVATAGGLLKLR